MHFSFQKCNLAKSLKKQVIVRMLCGMALCMCNGVPKEKAKLLVGMKGDGSPSETME